MRIPFAALGAAAALGCASNAVAGVIIQPKAVTVSVGGEQTDFPAINMINQSGLSTNYVSGVTDFDTYMGLTPVHSASAGEWLSTGPRTTARITFDLGEVTEISGFAFWNEDATSLGSIIASSTLGSYASSGNLAQNPTGVAYGPTVIKHQLIQTRYVTFDLYGCNQAGFAHNGCGLGEVAFRSTAAAPPPSGAVPEPTAWALMILGFGGVGTTLRRRRVAAMA